VAAWVRNGPDRAADGAHQPVFSRISKAMALTPTHWLISADFGQTFVHGLDADCRDDQCGAGAARMLTFAHPYIMDKEAMDKEAARRGQSDPGEDCIALLAASLSQYSFAFNTSTPRKGEGDCVSKGEAMPRR
jgi:hypothetical protein